MDINKLFKHIKPLSWEEVFNQWRLAEVDEPSRIEHYQKKGFKSWEAWRRTFTEPFKCEQESWDLYEVINPLISVPTFYGGPFRTWIKLYYKDKEAMTFKDLIKLPELKNHSGIIELANNFPRQTTLIGLIVNKRIIIIEGMHRCCAIALLKERGGTINSKIIIALAQSSLKRLPVVARATS